MRARSSYLIRKLLGHRDKHPDELISVRTRFARKFLPLTQPDLAHLIFTPDLHREFGLAQIDVIVRKNARDVIERSKPDIRAAQEQRVVFGMRVRACNQPVEAKSG